MITYPNEDLLNLPLERDADDSLSKNYDAFCFVEPCFDLWFDGCTCKNPVHSVLFPIPVFRNTSGLLLLLGLDFFAMIFPVVHRLVEVIDIMHSQTPPWILPQSISL
uniref:Uncharacterized protein n=1 Tax=Helianthus annuus TaxID=4232 RepID=A0A251UML3_HELAN